MSSIKERVPLTNIKQLLNKPNQKKIFEQRKKKEAKIHKLEKEIKKYERKRDKLIENAEKNGIFNAEEYNTINTTIKLLRNGTLRPI